MPDGVKKMAPVIMSPAAHIHGVHGLAAPDDVHAKLRSTELQLAAQARKCENLIAYFGAQLRRVGDQLRSERAARDPAAQQMEPVVAALLRFESKLRLEQSAIRQQLHDKDAQLNRLQREIVALREKHGDCSAAADLQIDRVAQFCPACRKEFHLMRCKEVAVQVGSDELEGRSGGGGGSGSSGSSICSSGSSHNSTEITMASTATTTATDTSSTPSIEYLSSSEEGAISLAPSFLEARRSKKYMSKRTSGTFRDYLRSRSTDPAGPGAASIAAAPVAAINPLMRRLSDVSAHRKHTGSALSTASGGADDPRGILKTPVPTVRRANSLHGSMGVGSYSSYINDVHGLRTSAATVVSDCAVRTPSESSPSSRHSEDIVEEAEQDAADDEVFVNGSPTAQGQTADDDGPSRQMLNASGFESTDDWYASVSDMEDSDSAPSKPYAYNAVNPVLECVNQILLQQSMDCTLESNHPTPDISRHSPPSIRHSSPPSPPTITSSPSPPSTASPPKPCTAQSHPTGTIKSQKRVHFSTQNSMVQVPRVDSFRYTIEPHYTSQQQQQLHPESHHQQPPQPPPASHHQHQFSYESVYSNEYEPIGSEGTCSVATTNHYVDMDSKNSLDDQQYQLKSPASTSQPPMPALLPPALPPKPSNLLKIRNVPRPLPQPLLPTSPTAATAASYHPTARPHRPQDADDTCTDTEPDYASILEIGPIVRAQPARKRPMIQQVIVEVHKAPTDSGDSSHGGGGGGRDDLAQLIVQPPPLFRGAAGRRLGSCSSSSQSLSSSDEASASTSSADDAFADVPKLPNVAAIISPKKETAAVGVGAVAVITQDNYITRSPPVAAACPLPPGILSKNAQNRAPPVVASAASAAKLILPGAGQSAAIAAPAKPLPTVAKPIAASAIIPVYEDKLRLQAEFDWYNLDVEYSGRKSAKLANGNHHHTAAMDRNEDDEDDDDDDEDEDEDDDHDADYAGDRRDEQGRCAAERMLMANEANGAAFSVEYKLDEEFSYSNGPYSNSMMRMHSSTPNGGELGGGRLHQQHQETIPEDDRDDDEEEEEELANTDAMVAEEAEQMKRTTEQILLAAPAQKRCAAAVAADDFETFLSETGLATKPLPRKRKIFY